MRNTFIFNEEKSFPLTGEEIITLPHPLIQFTAITIKRGNEPMLPFISKALKDIFNPTSPFATAPFLDLFFRGIPVNCGVNTNEANAFCSNFHSGAIKGSSRINDTFFAFSMMAAVRNLVYSWQLTLLYFTYLLVWFLKPLISREITPMEEDSQ